MNEDEDDKNPDSGDADEGDKTTRPNQVVTKVYSQHKVRISNKDRKLDAMLPVQAGDPTSMSTAPPALVAGAIVPEAPCSFTSIITLREEVKDNVHYREPTPDLMHPHLWPW